MNTQTTSQNWANRKIGRAFLNGVLASARGRAFILRFLAAGEAADEGAFDHMLSKSTDVAVRKMIAKHGEDEQRHARELEECIVRQGVDPGPLPRELGYIDRLHVATGEVFREVGGIVEQPHGIMRLAAMLQVVEERGTEQYGEIAKAMRRFDPQTADVIERIVEDEARHIKYARAIALRFAPNHEAYEQALEEMREIEARTFEQHGNDFLEYALEQELVTTGALGKPFWKLIVWLGKSRNRPETGHFTPVWARSA